MKIARRTTRAPQRPRLSRPPLERMMHLHQELKANRFPNCQKMAGTFEVSAKTIQRDIDFMRDRLSLPIEYDQLHFGFYYTQPVTQFPSMEVTEGEVVALFVAKKALEQYRGTPYEKALRSAFLKISAGLKERIDFAWDDPGGAVSFRPFGLGEANLERFETLSRAVLECLEIGFQYRKLAGRAFEGRRVRPYHMGCIENQWYLFGYDLDRGQLRTFALPRIRAIEISRRHFKRPTDFSLSRVLEGAFGVFAGDGDHRVRIVFDAFAGQLVAERRWHDSQKIEMKPDGTVELNMRLGSLEEVERWVLSWGQHAYVLEPPALAKRVLESAREICRMY